MGPKLPSIKKFGCLNCKHAYFRMSAREIGEIASGECPRCGGNLEVVEEAPEWLTKTLELVSEDFDILDVVAWVDRIEMEVSSSDPKTAFRSSLRKLRRNGYLPAMREREGELRLAVLKYPETKGRSVVINVILLIATIMTTFGAGYFLLFDGSFTNAALFSGALMLMLGSHEMGHKLAAWRNGVASTMPYFIPFPTLLGTFGAVIKIKSPIPTKEALVEMGAAGPLTGFVLSVVVTFVGLSFSVPSRFEPSLPFLPGVFAILELITFGRVTGGLRLNPLVFSGWVVMLLTMFNLIPAGQLDGGHIARSLLSRERHYRLTRILGFSLLVPGLLYPDYPFWVWGFFIILLFRGYHMGALDDVSGLSSRHKVLAAVALAVFLLCIPIPLL